MKKIVHFSALTFYLLFFLNTMQAQYTNTTNDVQQQKVPVKPKINHWFAGGMFGAGFSSYGGYVSVEPIVGYNITPAFQVGTRFSYVYSYENYYNVKYNLSSYGMGVFTRYIIFKGLFAQIEYEALNFPIYPYFDGDRMWVNGLFLGGGYYQTMGGRGFATFAILWNVLEDEYTPYTNPIFRIGFGANF